MVDLLPYALHNHQLVMHRWILTVLEREPRTISYAKLIRQTKENLLELFVCIQKEQRIGDVIRQPRQPRRNRFSCDSHEQLWLGLSIDTKRQRSNFLDELCSMQPTIGCRTSPKLTKFPTWAVISSAKTHAVLPSRLSPCFL